MDNTTVIDKVLIANKSGISYSGDIVGGSIEDEYIILHPSRKSEICVGMQVEDIDQIVYPNGKVDKLNIEANKSENQISDNCIMIRTNSGVTYRGEVVTGLVDIFKECDGYWLAPTEQRNILFWIPENEVKKIFGESHVKEK